ncbi:uncharacterized protein N7496_001917 [Penicillium cataractarum]|uniref:Uncharacterized protein n=1 Tax=Penicillium cataractarum TaxID=2100454 RepID=A0A9W9VX91_9EURO|nr:uncharacterized protein N7496_001917 [Penicillium cataractarum]KAJ5390849.1 hypothetical protein N7496_001917 [Penicillium cataractarum]
MHHPIITLLGILLPLFTSLVHANVEKTIFLGPPATTIPSEAPELDDLGLDRLSPQNGVVRTQLNASFPTAEAPEGTDSWFFLENLTPGQRYEVRICWLATQPTSFTLSTHPLPSITEDSTLLTSLSKFSASRLSNPDTNLQVNSLLRGSDTKAANDPAPTTDSVLFLRVRAAADYFSNDESLMRDVPSVAVDVILDPFLWNVFPRSLVPTAGWIVVVAIVAGVVARWVVGELGRVIEDARVERDEGEAKKEQ